jgi:hypothetical protein
VQAKIFFCRNDVQAIDFLRKGSYAPGVHMNYEKFKRSDGPDRFRSLTLLSTIFSPLLGKSFSMIT